MMTYVKVQDLLKCNNCNAPPPPINFYKDAPYVCKC